MAPTKTKTGFSVPCPFCGAKALAVKIENMSLECTDCNEEVKKSDLQKQLEDTQRLVNWMAASASF